MKWLFSFCMVILMTACSSGTNIFEGAGDVGNCKLQGSYVYDKDKDVYTLTGAGANMWAETDEFFMVWKEISGDFTLSARIAFEGEGVNEHRKIGLIIRESLQADARYADLAVHGDGLTSLQYRSEKGGITQELKSENQMPDHIMLERTGNRISMKTGIGKYPEQADATLELALPQKCYVGLFICSHEDDVLETGYFSDVSLVHANAATSDTKSENKSTIEKVVAWYMDNMNYGTVTLLMTVESSFIPFPSEVIVPPAAYIASQEDSDMNIVMVVVFATIGALLGSIFNYYLALYLGRPVFYRFAESRIGRMCLLSVEKVKKAEALFVKHGNMTTLICRLIPGIRQLISVPAGFARMNFGNFILYTFIGASLWNIILAVLGYIAHGNAEIINNNSKILSYILIGLGLLFGLYLIYNGFFKKDGKKS